MQAMQLILQAMYSKAGNGPGCSHCSAIALSPCPVSSSPFLTFFVCELYKICTCREKGEGIGYEIRSILGTMLVEMHIE